MIVTSATPEIMEQFYGEKPAFSSRSVAVMNGDHPVALAGIMRKDRKMLYYADISDELRESPEYKRMVIKAYRKLAGFMPDCPVYAMADPDIEGSETLLKHLGFRQVGEFIWRV